MSNSKHDDEILGEIGQALLALFCNQDNISDQDILNTIEAFNANNGSNLTWEHVQPMIDRLRALYPSSPLPWWIPSRYEYVRPLAAGATAKVFLAFDSKCNNQVAIKLLDPRESIKRVQRETEILRTLESNYIVRLTDAIFNFDNPTRTHAALVMEFVDGLYLDRIIKENNNVPHALNEATRWMIQAALALQDAHDQGVIHRDIKPANLVVTHENRAIKLLDFGLASNIDRSTSLTNSGDLLGTPHYIAPEQSRDASTLDPRNDIYSYGATFYHLLTGTTPFEGDHFELVVHHRNSILESPKARNPQLPQTVNHIVEKCMAKNARDRYQTFEELLNDLTPEQPPTVMSELSERVDTMDSLPENPLSSSQIDGDVIESTKYEIRESPQVWRKELFSINPAPANRSITYNGDRTLEIIWGDLLNESTTTEVIVVCDDNQLSMGGGTAKRILDAAGPDYFISTRHLAPAMPGRVITSSAGDLSQRFIFHAITIAQTDSREKVLSPTPDLIRSLLDSCFYHAESLGITSMTIPLLGTGYAAMDSKICYQTIVEHVGRELEYGLTPVNTVRLVIPEGVVV